MNIERKGSFLCTVALIIIPLLIIFGRYTFSEEARLVPLLTGGVTIIFGIIVLLSEIYPRIRAMLEADFLDVGGGGSKKDSGAAEVIDAGSSKGMLRMLGGFGLMVAFFILVYLVGYLLAIPAFVFCFFKFISRSSWVFTISMTLAVWGFIFVVFYHIMKLELFQGILWGGIAPRFFSS